MRSGDAEEGSECGMPGAPAVEAEDGFIEVGLGDVCDAARSRRPGPTPSRWNRCR